MRLLIIRHGEPDYPNNTLTEKGFKEVDLLGKFLKNEEIDELYSSPIPRASLTADGIVKYHPELKVTYKDWLKEMDTRTWDRRCTLLDRKETFDPELNEWMKTVYADPEEVKRRTLEAYNGLDEILKNNGYIRDGYLYKAVNPNHRTICLTCHFGIESYLLSHLFNTSPIMIANFFVSRPTGITRLQTEEREDGKAIFRLNEFGSTTHLRLENEPLSGMALLAETYTDFGYKYEDGNDKKVLK